MSNDLSHLKLIASKYDLADPEDRANFRTEINRAHRATRLSAINEWVGKEHKSRYDALRDLANQYIDSNKPQSKRSGGTVCW